jgi:TetR/AcrR family acrAB operon transcriptional repressor
MARRSRKESLETRERLLDAALEVFQARGVSRPSLSDIAVRAGVTRGAIYVHFANKADLFSALLDRTLLPPEALSAWNPCAGTPLERLHASCVFLLRQTALDPHWTTMFDIVFHKCEKLEENGAIVQRLRRAREEGMGNLARLAREAVAEGELPADLDVDLAIGLLHSSLIGTMSQWLLHRTGVDLATQATACADALVHMLRTAPSLRRGAATGTATCAARVAPIG